MLRDLECARDPDGSWTAEHDRQARRMSVDRVVHAMGCVAGETQLRQRSDELPHGTRPTPHERVQLRRPMGSNCACDVFKCGMQRGQLSHQRVELRHATWPNCRINAWNCGMQRGPTVASNTWNCGMQRGQLRHATWLTVASTRGTAACDVVNCGM